MSDWFEYDDMIFRLLINIVATVLLLWLMYRNKSTQQETLHAFFLFGIGVFLVTSLLHDVEMSMGFAFGLFAVFSMLRYRTESLNVKDMTCLFIIIAMSLMSAVSNTNLLDLIYIHGLICLIAGISHWKLNCNNVKELFVLYEEIENIKPERYSLLIDDLKCRTGLMVLSAKVLNVDFLHDTANICITYRQNSMSYLPSISTNKASSYSDNTQPKDGTENTNASANLNSQPNDRLR